MGLDYSKHASAVEATTVDALMDEYGDDAVKYAYAITRDRELAQDIAQETFIRAKRRSRSIGIEISNTTGRLGPPRRVRLE